MNIISMSIISIQIHIVQNKRLCKKWYIKHFFVYSLTWRQKFVNTPLHFTIWHLLTITEPPSFLLIIMLECVRTPSVMVDLIYFKHPHDFNTIYDYFKPYSRHKSLNQFSSEQLRVNRNNKFFFLKKTWFTLHDKRENGGKFIIKKNK